MGGFADDFVDVSASGEGFIGCCDRGFGCASDVVGSDRFGVLFGQRGRGGKRRDGVQVCRSADFGKLPGVGEVVGCGDCIDFSGFDVEVCEGLVDGLVRR